MIVLTLTDCPPSLRGDLTKWLLEINTGVYVGRVSARVRDELWTRVTEHAKTGKATLVYPAKNEQRMNFRVHNTVWEPINFDGITLILRPSPARLAKGQALKPGFSKAAQFHKAKKMARRSRAVQNLPQEYVIIDVETTGLSAVDDEIIEIGALKVVDDIVQESIQVLVNSNIELPKNVTALTGITDSQLKMQGKPLSEAMVEFLAFVGEKTIVSHNVSFDYSFLCVACEKSGLPMFINRSVDTLTLARRLIKGVKNYQLETLLDYFQIVHGDMHRSLEDCMGTLKLYEKLTKILKSEN